MHCISAHHSMPHVAFMRQGKGFTGKRVPCMGSNLDSQWISHRFLAGKLILTGICPALGHPIGIIPLTAFTSAAIWLDIHSFVLQICSEHLMWRLIVVENPAA